MPSQIPAASRDYLTQRLDGARDLYLLALAVGERDKGQRSFGRVIQESRIHFAGVIEEARIAGLDTSDIGGMLSSTKLADSLRPELWKRLEELLRARPKV